MNVQDIKGQAHAKRALEVAMAGRHSTLLVGPHSVGKTLLIESAIDLLNRESTALARITTQSPMRDVRKAITAAEDGGLLILDDMHLLSPAKQKEIEQRRQGRIVVCPSVPVMLASILPCSCGNRMSQRIECLCSVRQLSNWLCKFRELARHFDICIEIPELRQRDLMADGPHGEQAETVRARIERCKHTQAIRYRAQHYEFNAFISPADMQKYCKLDDDARTLMKAAIQNLGLQSRAYDNILKVAQTIADLDNWGGDIRAQHVAEAIQYRPLDYIR